MLNYNFYECNVQQIQTNALLNQSIDWPNKIKKTYPIFGNWDFLFIAIQWKNTFAFRIITVASRNLAFFKQLFCKHI